MPGIGTILVFSKGGKGGGNGGASFPEWQQITAISFPTLGYVPDMSTSNAEKLNIADTIDTIDFIAPTNVDSTKTREKRVIVDNSVNSLPVSVINFSSEYSEYAGSVPTGGIASGAVWEFRITNIYGYITIDASLISSL